ncbi:hypothetical protein DPMN_103665 [Dreissena polymorpha]|uniref:FLYWCH-type domain-containing protein n=1 Tax=Dreissena polymorpha TaxID=45954 RepID=A0A9D4K0D9_DREPO|nr:hypothetical protein DPMN_103665 [Dreissena polymorpha]
MRGKKELIFTCCACKENEMEDSGAAQQPEQMEGVAHSTMIDASEELPPLPSITFNLEFSLGTLTSTDTTAADTTGVEPDDNYDNTENTNTENEPDNAPAYFDLSRDGPTLVQVIVEDPLPDAPLTDTIIEDGEIRYEVVEEGTERRKKKLVSSDGYTYVQKQKPTARSVQWRCSVRRQNLRCYACVNQQGDIFTAGTVKHCHPADGLASKRVTLNRDVSFIVSQMLSFVQTGINTYILHEII